MSMQEIELGLRLADVAKLSALGGAGQETLIQAILRQGMVTPLRDRATDLAMATALVTEPLVEDQAMDLLAFLLQVEGDHPVALGPQEGVQLLFQSVNSGLGWVRFFRVEGETYRHQVETEFPNLVELVAQEENPVLQGLLGMPIGTKIEPEAVGDLLNTTRWRSGHWMAAVYVPHRNGFAVLGLGYQLLKSLSQGEAILQEGTKAAAVLRDSPDRDLLPARGHATGLGALWGGEAFAEGLSLGLARSMRVDIQWAPVSYGSMSTGGTPFLGVEVPGVEQGLLGVLLTAPTNRILVVFEVDANPDLVSLGPLDSASQEYLVNRFGLQRGSDERLVLRRAAVSQLAMQGMPIWNRILRPF